MMNGELRSRNHPVSAVFIFLLLGIFALFSLVLILFGAQAYRSTVNRSDAHNTERVLSSYIRNAVRTQDYTDGIRIEEKEGIVTLALYDPEDNGEYAKYIYVFDGMLREYYAETNAEFDPEYGEIISGADSMTIDCNGSMLTVVIMADGMEYRTDMALRCGGDLL